DQEVETACDARAVLPSRKTDRAFYIIAPMRRRRGTIENNRFPGLPRQIPQFFPVNREAERREFFERRNAPNKPLVLHPKEQQHPGFPPCESPRHPTPCRKVIYTFARHVDPPGSAHHTP